MNSELGELLYVGKGNFCCTQGECRWDESEHKIFLEGLQKYGNDWKQIANMISTRNLVQVRTHAQKYFQKINKGVRANSTSYYKAGTKSNYSETRVKKDITRVKPKYEPVKPVVEVNSPVSITVSDSSNSSQLHVPNPGFILSKPDYDQDHTIMMTRQPLPVSLSPISRDYGCFDYDSSYESNRNPYYTYSSFEFECNDNFDDMEYCDCADLKTPIFN